MRSGMESLNLVNTRLPPRKRLLAGLKTVSPSCNLDLPLPLASSDLGAHLRDVLSSGASSPEVIAEAARSMALAAAKVAEAARAAAMEKAAIAAKARAAAKSALELLDSISRSGAPCIGRRAKLKLRKRHVPINLLYKAIGPLEDQEKKKLAGSAEKDGTDEELARKLHHAVNSSPRISKSKQKNPPVNGKEEMSGGGSMSDGLTTTGNSVVKPEKETVVCSKVDILEAENSSRCSRKRSLVLGPGGISGGRKAKIKRKKLLLSECCGRAPEEPKEIPPSVECIVTEESNVDTEGSRMSDRDLETSSDVPVKLKITSMWKSKKFNKSQCPSDGKILHSICSGPPVAKTSAVVKVD